MSDKKAEAPAAAEGAPASGGIKAMLPLILNVVLMPVMAYVMTVFVLLPKINSNAIHAEAKAADGGHGAAEESGDHGEKASGHGEEAGSKGGHGGSGGRNAVPLSNKVIVNVSGTAGTRYLLANISIVGPKADLKEKVEKADAQLRDVAASVLAVKTIADVDKPGARNLIRTELVSAFNSVLGEGSVKEIYFTEFAIQ